MLKLKHKTETSADDDYIFFAIIIIFLYFRHIS